MNKRKFKRIEIPKDVNVNTLSPLEISCGTTKCSDDFHCFSLKRTSIKNFNKTGVCKNCGSDLIDWKRIHKKDLSDVNFVFSSLKKELFRHVIWHVEISPVAKKKALQLSPEQQREKTKSIMKKKIMKKGFRDGTQTPPGGNEITYYAQHATATCCRKCIEVWYNIPEVQELTEQQLDFFVDLALLFINEKIQSFSSDE